MIKVISEHDNYTQAWPEGASQGGQARPRGAHPLAQRKEGACQGSRTDAVLDVGAWGLDGDDDAEGKPQVSNEIRKSLQFAAVGISVVVGLQKGWLAGFATFLGLAFFFAFFVPRATRP